MDQQITQVSTFDLVSTMNHTTCSIKKVNADEASMFIFKSHLLYTMANANIPPVLVPMIQSNNSMIGLLAILSMVISMSIKIKPLMPPPSRHSTRSPCGLRPMCQWSGLTTGLFDVKPWSAREGIYTRNFHY